MKQSIPKFKSIKELHKFLKDNKDTLIAEKMMQTKFADPVNGLIDFFDITNGTTRKVMTFKDDSVEMGDAPERDKLKVVVVINSTNIIDSCWDMHIPSIWKKSISENKNIKFLKEHNMGFDYILADKENLKVYTKSLKWSELGLSYKGVTECLIFDATIKNKRSKSAESMIEHYANGDVDQHSVGMRYVSLEMCINSDEKYYRDEKEAWEKYYPMAVNPEVADEYGFFYAVTQAKVIEGSAVVLGANSATPTLLVEESEPQKSTPVGGPSKDIRAVDYQYLLQNVNLSN